MSQKSTINTRGRVASIVAVVVALLFCGAIVWQRDSIADHVLAYQYVPSPELTTLRDDLKLTGYGALLFNASQPKLQSADEFNKSCQQEKEAKNPILGCYTARQVFIYDIDNQKLKGIKEVTVAHELLHAAYERLNESRRQEVDAEIRKVLRTVMTPELQERLAYYEKHEPGQENNELHAILGTEFARLSDGLETHYREYFQDRQHIVRYYQAYNSVFEDVTGRLTSELDSINALTRSVNSRIAAYNKQQVALSADISSFNRRAESGGYDSQSAYQADRNALESRRAALQSDRKAIEADIKKIGQQSKEYDHLREQYEALSRSINSSLDPVAEFKT